ncbi:DUF368 domain-containing protein [Saprospira grandis]|uniref:Integral membrane protein n=1 Tax=Saprospira grandis (strain Lewin) TaxID=984262 RepID=H6L3P8_SAPGL|nr:DUF368 domain-containing protein [Saprospira grandis]AFC24996.1 hypothetical protein SGRA_2267 [Saprospira grandis str. Lewin]
MQHLFTFLKGMAMGAADVVPGVSGGTVAFITGIYERLLRGIKGVNLESLKVLQRQGIAAFWTAIDGNFLLALFGGIFVSVLSLASLLSSALEHYPQLLWSFFMGLVLASALYVGRQIKWNNLPSIVLLIMGAGIAYGITLFVPTEMPKSYPMAFISGAIAICAMILPGISGSFILLLMGMYKHVIEAIHERDILFLLVFMMGCGLGLLSFARILSWLFEHYRSAALALLTGFMLGSLPKIWPWQNVIQTRINSHGEEEPFLFQSVLPNAYEGEPYLLGASLLALLGFALVFGLERLGQKTGE